MSGNLSSLPVFLLSACFSFLFLCSYYSSSFPLSLGLITLLRLSVFMSFGLNWSLLSLHSWKDIDLHLSAWCDIFLLFAAKLYTLSVHHRVVHSFGLSVFFSVYVFAVLTLSLSRSHPPPGELPPSRLFSLSNNAFMSLGVWPRTCPPQVHCVHGSEAMIFSSGLDRTFVHFLFHSFNCHGSNGCNVAAVTFPPLCSRWEVCAGGEEWHSVPAPRLLRAPPRRQGKVPNPFKRALMGQRGLAPHRSPTPSWLCVPAAVITRNISARYSFINSHVWKGKERRKEKQSCCCVWGWMWGNNGHFGRWWRHESMQIPLSTLSNTRHSSKQHFLFTPPCILLQ